MDGYLLFLHQKELEDTSQKIYLYLFHGSYKNVRVLSNLKKVFVEEWINFPKSKTIILDLKTNKNGSI